LPVGRLDQNLGQSHRVEHIAGCHPAHRLRDPVAVAGVGVLGDDPVVQDRGQPVGRIIAVGSCAVAEQVAVVILGRRGKN
jgi:hypothetical protein